MKNQKRILILSGFLLVLVIIAAVIFISVRKKADKVEEPAFVPVLEPNAVVQTDRMDQTAEQTEGIRIPGYPRITVEADTTDVTMNLKNPEGNPCYFTFEIVLTDENETIYVSKMVEPGKAVTNVTLSRALNKGEYPAMIKIKTTSLADGLEMNGANVETILVVQ